MKQPSNGNFHFTIIIILLFLSIFSLVTIKLCKLIQNIQMLGITKDWHYIIQENMKQPSNGNFHFTIIIILLFLSIFSLVTIKLCKLIQKIQMLGITKDLHQIIKENMKQPSNGNFHFTIIIILLFLSIFSLVTIKLCKLIQKIQLLGATKDWHQIIQENMKQPSNGNFHFTIIIIILFFNFSYN